MTDRSATTLVWFRDDLRLADNAALEWAAQRGEVIAVVIDEDAAATGVRPRGAAASWWRERSLSRLAGRLLEHGVPMLHLAGDPVDIANAHLFLASDEAKYVTGASLDVNGGVQLR